MERFGKTSLLIAAERFLEALGTSSPGSAGLTPDARCTYNGVVDALGSGAVWQETVRIPARQTFVDVETRSVVFFGVITNRTTGHASVIATDWFYAVRLHCGAGGIDEVEELVFAGTWGHYSTPADAVEADARFEALLPDDERRPRRELTRIVEAYWAAVDRSGSADAVPLHPDARRTEIGQQTTDAWNFPHSAREDFAQPGWSWALSNIRYPVIDEARGVVVSLAILTTNTHSNPQFGPALLAEAFKIENGLIRRMFAVYVPGLNDDGWTTSRKVDVM